MSELQNTEPLYDPCQTRAYAMKRHLSALGVVSYVHWDRSPWGVRIPLTEDHTEFGPSLFVLTEGQQHGYADHFDNVWVWQGQLAYFPEDDPASPDLIETSFTWAERHWLDAGTESVAAYVAPLVRLLTVGAAAFIPVASVAPDTATDATGCGIREGWQQANTAELYGVSYVEALGAEETPEEHATRRGAEEYPRDATQAAAYAAGVLTGRKRWNDGQQEDGSPRPQD
jgi:hypothetical protein